MMIQGKVIGFVPKILESCPKIYRRKGRLQPIKFHFFQKILLFETMIKWKNQSREQYEIMKKIDIWHSYVWKLFKREIWCPFTKLKFFFLWLTEKFHNFFLWVINGFCRVFSRNRLTKFIIFSLLLSENLPWLFSVTDWWISQYFPTANFAIFPPWLMTKFMIFFSQPIDKFHVFFSATNQRNSWFFSFDKSTNFVLIPWHINEIHDFFLRIWLRNFTNFFHD